MEPQKFQVGMADIHVAKESGIFTCLGLGSCIGLVLFDPKANVGGMAHIMLPESTPGKAIQQPGKYADTCLPALVESLTALGAEQRRLIAAYSGGAQVFKFGTTAGSTLDIGARNADAVMTYLLRFRIPTVKFDVGGSNGRTVVYDLAHGFITVKTISQGEKLLCNIRTQEARLCGKVA